MNIHNFSREAVSLDSVKSWFKNNITSKMTDQHKRIAAAFALALGVFSACYLLYKCTRSNEDEGEPAICPIPKVVANAKVNPAKVKVEAEVPQTNESKLNKKSGIKIIKAEDYSDQEKAIESVKSLSPSKYLEEQYAGHKYYKTFLAVKEDNNEIVGYLSAEKKPPGFELHKYYVDSSDTSKNELLIRLFLNAMENAKFFEKQTFTITSDASDLTPKFCQDFKKFDVEFTEYKDKNNKMIDLHLEKYQYNKALEILLNR